MRISWWTAEGQGWQIWSCWRPRSGLPVGGDLCHAYRGAEGLVFALIDVLGHGKDAYRSAEALQRILLAHPADITFAFNQIEQSASRTRGCALFLGSLIDSSLRFVMVGNIRGWWNTGSGWELLKGQTGVVGGRKLVPLVRQVQGAEGIIVCSDGIRRTFVPADGRRWFWDSEGQQITAQILEEYGIPEDDASVLVARRCKNEPGDLLHHL
ncbi:MAG: hypothetical protein HPY81_07990 [Firmicutes bacterium]|nr:hypothetical protein [Bacillota bacterium]